MKLPGNLYLTRLVELDSLPLAEKLGMIDGALVARQNALLNQLRIPIEPPRISPADFVSAILRDKKAVNGQARFILPTRIGHVELVSDVHADLAFGAIAD